MIETSKPKMSDRKEVRAEMALQSLTKYFKLINLNHYNCYKVLDYCFFGYFEKD